MGGGGSKPITAPREVVQLDQCPKIKDYMKYLVQWSGHSKGEVIYDSNNDSKLAKEFYSMSLNKPNSYFITLDSEGNIFGAYFEKPVDQLDTWIYDEKNFIFVLESLGRLKEPTKWSAKVGESGGIRFYSNDLTKLFEVGNGEFMCGMRYGYYSIADVNVKNSFCSNLSYRYEGINNDDLCGVNLPSNLFCADRIVVVQMSN